MEQHLQSLLSIVMTQVIKCGTRSDIDTLRILETWCVQNVNRVLCIATIWSLDGPGNEEWNSITMRSLPNAVECTVGIYS